MKLTYGPFRIQEQANHEEKGPTPNRSRLAKHLHMVALPKGHPVPCRSMGFLLREEKRGFFLDYAHLFVANLSGICHDVSHLSPQASLPVAVLEEDDEGVWPSSMIFFMFLCRMHAYALCHSPFFYSLNCT